MTDHASKPKRKKKPYTRPQITFREPMELFAVACTPSPPAKGSPAACPVGPISS